MNTCPQCHDVTLVFQYTDYYDFDVFVCPKCGYQDYIPQDFYLDDESLLAQYGDDYFDDMDWMDGEE